MKTLIILMLIGALISLAGKFLLGFGIFTIIAVSLFGWAKLATRNRYLEYKNGR